MAKADMLKLVAGGVLVLCTLIIATHPGSQGGKSGTKVVTKVTVPAPAPITKAPEELPPPVVVPVAFSPANVDVAAIYVKVGGDELDAYFTRHDAQAHIGTNNPYAYFNLSLVRDSVRDGHSPEWLMPWSFYLTFREDKSPF